MRVKKRSSVCIPFFRPFISLLILGISSTSFAGETVEVEATWAPDGSHQSTQAPQKVAVGLNLPALIELPSAESAALDQLIAIEEKRSRGDKPLQVGFNRSFPGRKIEITRDDVSGNSAPRASDYLAVEGSEVVWSGRIQVAQAVAFRVYLQDVQLPRTARLWVYSPSDQILGPFDSKLIDANGGMWLPAIEGGEAYIEIRVPASELERGETIRFTLQQISELAFGLDVAANQERFWSEPQVWTDCAIDATCELGAPFSIDDFARGIALLFYTDDAGGTYICTGGMITDTVDATFIPYLLTANHCFDSPTEAASLTAYFDYRSDTCGGSPPSLGTVPQVSGADLLASNPISDFTLVRLSSLPSGRLLFGWTTATPADGEILYGLHHPNGEKTHYSTSSFNASGGIVCGGLPRPDFHYSTGVTGSTAPGSSGSPTFDPTGKIYGQLLGACHFQTWDDCDYGTYNRVDGAFATTYPYVEEWLNPQACQDDQYEDDDVCFGTEIDINTFQDHSHCDEDWVYFNPEFGHTYRIETFNLGGGSDTVLSLHEDCQAAFLTDDDGGAEPLASRIDYTAQSSVPIDVRITQFGDLYAAGETYSISVTDITPLYPLTVTKSGPGFGVVTSDLPGINCGPDCSADYYENDYVTLTATPDLGSQFVEWTGDCSGTNPVYSVTITAATTCNAVFDLAPVYYDLLVTKSGAGNCTVSSNPAGINCGADCSESYLEGTAVTLLATPDAGSYFVEWSPGNCVSDPGAGTTVTMDSNKTCNVQCELEVYRNLFVTTAGTGSGTVASDPAGIDCPGDCSEDYLDGTDVTLTATPSPGSYFVGWVGGYCDAGPNPIVVPMNASRVCTAQFDLVPAQYLLTVSKIGTGSGTVVSDPAGIDCGAACSASYTDGTNVTLTAAPAPGSQFIGWTGACSGTNPITAVIMNAVKACNAQFDVEVPGEQQIVYGVPGAVGAQAGGPARFDVMYDVSDADATLTGIGIRVHYDSSKLTFDQVNETLAFGRLFDPGLVAPEPDNADYDADPNTDSFLSLAWVDFGGNWPGSLPEKLAAVHFTTAPGFTGDTPVNFTASDLAAGYALDASVVTVFEQPCTLDVDDNGVYGALTDGVLIVRHLFGFTGQQLIDGALALDANRILSEEIIAYLAGCPDMLDPDGNGLYGALTDGVLIVRYLFGFTGQQLVDGALAPDATRTDPGAIIAYLDGYSPALSPPALQASPEQGTAPRGLQELASRVSRAAARGSDKVYDVTVDYAASEASLTGLGLRMHFDSSRLSLLGLSDVFATGMLQYQVQDDVLDYDGDASTDRFVLVSWMDPWGDWPGAYEAELFTARFKAVKRQGSGKTTVRYTVAEAAAGMEARFEPVEIGPGSNGRNAD